VILILLMVNGLYWEWWCHRYVTFDDANARRLAQQDPELFFETYGYPLLIDEFQRVPSILLEMKRIVDQKSLSGEDNGGLFCPDLDSLRKRFVCNRPQAVNSNTLLKNIC